MRLKPFNPEKELKKLNKKYTKKHLIISLLVLIVMISIGSSYAIFSITPQSYEIINSKVGEFSTGDIKLSVTVEGVSQSEFPAKGTGYVFDKVTCENGGTGIWDANNWQLKLSVGGPDECTINFEKIVTGAEYIESLLVNNPTTMNNDDPDGNVRYMGADPNNYVRFDDDLWRIIGVFNVKSDVNSQLEKRIKIIEDKNSPNGYGSWNTSNINDWANSSIESYLNGYYIQYEYKNFIGEAYWNLGGSSTYDDVTTSMFYERERGTDVYDGRSTYWIGNIGLMYPSDYGYATSGGATYNRDFCLQLPLYRWSYVTYSDCNENNYLYSFSFYQWTMTPYAGSSDGVFRIGYGSDFEVVPANTDGPAARLTLYLKSNVLITSGDGSENNPYVLELYK